MAEVSHKKYFVYVLWSDSGHRFYIGSSESVEQRLAQHNNGKSRWTKRYAGSWKLVWQREFDSIGNARKYETLLKHQKKGNGFFRLTGLGHFQASGS